MLLLLTTQKARDVLGIGKAALDDDEVCDSLLGSWVLTVAPMGRREALLFFSSRTLLSFPIMMGERRPTVADMPACLSHGIRQLVHGMEADPARLSSLLAELEEVRVARLVNRSLIAMSGALGTAYDFRAQRGDELGKSIRNVNGLPRPALKYKSPTEATLKLLSHGEAG